MKKRIVRSFIFAMLLVSTSCCAAMAETLSGTVSTKFLPKYVCGNDTVAHDKPVNQTNLFVSLGNGLYANIWGSKSLVGAGYGNEIDATIGYAGPLGKTSNLKMDAGLSYFIMIPMDTMNQDIISPYFELSMKAFDNGISPYAKVDLYFTIGGDEPTVRSHVGASHQWAGTETILLSQDLQMTYDYVAAAPSKTSLTVQHGIVAAWSISKAASIDLRNDIYLPIAGKDREINVVPGIGATYRF